MELISGPQQIKGVDLASTVLSSWYDEDCNIILAVYSKSCIMKTVTSSYLCDLTLHPVRRASMVSMLGSSPGERSPTTPPSAPTPTTSSPSWMNRAQEPSLSGWGQNAFTDNSLLNRFCLCEFRMSDGLRLDSPIKTFIHSEELYKSEVLKVNHFLKINFRQSLFKLLLS